MTKRISIDTNEMTWQRASEVFPGYVLDTDDPEAGIFVKPLRGPDDGGGCWHCLLRFRPPAGRAIKVTAVARSDEEVFILNSGRAGQYGCNPMGLRHGQTVTEDTTILVHYHAAPDEVLRAEVVDRAAP